MASVSFLARDGETDGAIARRARRRVVVSGFCFVLLLYLLLVGIEPLSEFDFGKASSTGDPITQLGTVAVAGVLFLSGGGLPTRRELLALPVGVALVLGWCLLSVSWAIAPDVALRRSLHLAIVAWMMFRIVGDLGSARTLLILRWALLFLLVANFLTVALSPVGIHRDVFDDEFAVVGHWRGLMKHKNLAGATCAITILLFTMNVRSFPRLVGPAVAVAATIFLYFAHSRTSAFALIIALCVAAAVRPYNPRFRTGFIAGALVLVAAGGQWLIADGARFFDRVLDAGVLSGREAIWPLLLEYAGEHPWTGAGFGSFWGIGYASPIWSLTDSWVAQKLNHGHNGYLDLLVTIGVPGLLLVLTFLFAWPVARLMLSPAVHRSERSLLLALLVFAAAQNLSESTLLNTASVVNVTLLLTVAIIYRRTSGGDRWHSVLWQVLRGRAADTGVAPPSRAAVAPVQRLRRW